MSAPVVAELPSFSGDAYFADPYPTFAAVREIGPVVRVESPPHWFVTGHAEADVILRSPSAKAEGFARRQRSITARYGSEFDPLVQIVRLQMVLMNAPDHPRVRRALQGIFTPRAIEEMRPTVRQVVRTLLDTARSSESSSGTFDLVGALASPLPATVVALLLGVPEDDTEQFVRWSAELVSFVGTTRSDAAHLQAVQADMIEWSAFFERLAARQRGRDTILGRLIALTETEQLSWDELVANAIFLMAAGHETTTSLIGNAMLAFSRSPAQWQRLRADPSMVRGAVDELLRFDPPVQFAWRVVADPLEVGGLTLPAGDMVNVCIAAANRDPRAYEDPDVVTVDRRADDHLAFALGAHYCLGAALARMEGQEALGALLDELPTVTLAGAARFRPNPTFRGLESLPLVRTC